jgi:hypothetical protein
MRGPARHCNINSPLKDLPSVLRRSGESTRIPVVRLLDSTISRRMTGLGNFSERFCTRSEWPLPALYCRNVHGAALVTSDPLPAPVLFVVCVCSWVLLIAFTLIETAKLNKVDPQA